jgi:trafficking protein particle complex subunit 6
VTVASRLRLVLGGAELIADTQAVIKLVCLDLWRALHGKNADRLSRERRTSAYIIEDKEFRFFRTLAAPSGVDVRDVAGKYTVFSKGAVRGCLRALGIEATVLVDWTEFPGVRFRLVLDPSSRAGSA